MGVYETIDHQKYHTTVLCMNFSNETQVSQKEKVHFGACVHDLTLYYVDFKLDTIKGIESLPEEKGDQCQLVDLTTEKPSFQDTLSESEDEEKRRKEKEAEALGEIHENSS